MADALLALVHSDSPNLAGLPDWEPYRLELRATMIFDVTPALVDNPRGAERRLCTRVPFIQQGA